GPGAGLLLLLPRLLPRLLLRWLWLLPGPRAGVPCGVPEGRAAGIARSRRRRVSEAAPIRERAGSASVRRWTLPDSPARGNGAVLGHIDP
uniref:hypothetical protein n=1 Tax=Curtobacterium sp. UCD-KPL2560 TaxID=1885315 RepID=UPI001C0B7A8F